ncbi:MAG: pyrroline-5-carboxylate reductase family protein [Solirubrobacterales bacterium]
MIIGFAGAGNLASALALGWASAEGGPDSMLFCDAGSGRAARLAEQTGGEAVDSLAELALRSDAVLLALKPGALDTAAELLGGDAKAIVSVLGVTPVSRLRELFPTVPVVRVMPTVAVEVQSGVICHAPIDPDADGATGAHLLDLLAELGHLVEVPDALMDQACAVMACSPAYLAVVVQNLAEEGAAQGLEDEQAYDLVIEAFAGTIELLRRYDPITVRTAVASPGGSTEAGLEALADAGAADAFKAAVRASLARMRGDD